MGITASYFNSGDHTMIFKLLEWIHEPDWTVWWADSGMELQYLHMVISTQKKTSVSTLD